MTVGVALSRDHLEPRRRAANHQWLTTADEDVEATVVLRHHRHADIARQLADRFIARVEQVVRLLAVGCSNRNRLVETTDAAGQTIDLVGDGGHLLVGEIVLLGEPVVDRIEAPRQTFGLGQHQLARRNVCRVFSRRLQGGEELLQRGRDAGGGASEQRVELVDLALVRLDVAVQRCAAAQLAGQELAVGAPHVDQRCARTDVTGTAELRRTGRLGRILTAVARRVDVGDVVAGDGQLGLAGGQAGQANTQ